MEKIEIKQKGKAGTGWNKTHETPLKKVTPRGERHGGEPAERLGGFCSMDVTAYYHMNV
jgi:hypothetical protein